MSNLTKHEGKIPKKEWIKAWVQWIGVLIPYSILAFLTIPLGLIVAATSKPQSKHPQGKPITQPHSDRYKAEGSSGNWDYRNSNIPFVKWWNNYEDGTLGEPSGKNSANRKGKERTFLSQYLWTIRNPFNWGKRTLPYFHCKVNDCTIEYWGDFEVSDKEFTQDASHFVKATNVYTGKVYYWYRSVKFVDRSTVRQTAIGFKLKPSHALTVQDVDDLDKAFTIRPPVKTTID